MSSYDEDMMVAQCACGAIMSSDQFQCDACNCERRGCTLPVRTHHYHCAHCDSPATTSMMGHYGSEDHGKTWGFSCEKRGISDA